MNQTPNPPPVIFLRAGHHRDDPGAVAHGLQENLLTIELRDLLAAELRKRGAVVNLDKDEDDLATDVHKIAALCQPSDVLLDLHFNAASPSATGTECYVPYVPSPDELLLANAIANTAARALGIINRHQANGYSPKSEMQSQHGRLAVMRPTCKNILWEVCFLTNKRDIAAYQRYKKKLVTAMAQTLMEQVYVA